MVGAHNLCYYVYSFIHSQPLLEESVNCLMHISDPITCVRLLCPDCIGKAIKVINNKELGDDLILDEDKHINLSISRAEKNILLFQTRVALGSSKAT